MTKDTERAAWEAHHVALTITHDEAGRTLSKKDFDLCMRIATRAFLDGRAALAQEAQAVPSVDAVRRLFRPWPEGELGPNDEPESQYQLGYNTAIEDALEAIEAAPQSVPAQPVAIYQIEDEGAWVDVSEVAFNACDLVTKMRKRIVYTAPPAAQDVPRALTVNEQLIEALHDSLTMIGRIKKHCGITDNAGYTPDGRMLRLVDVENRARTILTAAGAK